MTQKDLERLAYNEYLSFHLIGTQPGDIYQLMLTLDRQFMAGMAYYTGAQRASATVLRTGPGLPFMQWNVMKQLDVTGLVAVPSFILSMLSAPPVGGLPQSVRKILAIGEPLRNDDLSPNTLANKITEQWPVQLFNTYASTEMQTGFTECTAGKGGHHHPELIIVELLNDEGYPVAEGEVGEVTITTLGVEAMPLLRYRTGDICRGHYEPCSCGRHTLRLGPVLGRKQQMIKYRGTTLYPPAIFEILNGIDIVKSYVVEVLTGELGTDELVLHIHTPLPVDSCEQVLRPLLQSRLRVVPRITYHTATEISAMQFPQASRKQVKFVDNRRK